MGSVKFKLHIFIDKNSKKYFKLTVKFENSYKTNEFIKLYSSNTK